MPNPEIVHPTPEDGIDDHLANRVADVLPGDFPELGKKCLPLLLPGQASSVAGRSFSHECDAKMYHLKTASLCDLRYRFKKVEHHLRQGEEVQITERRHVIAVLVGEQTPVPPDLPDFMGRMRAIYGTKKLKVSGADLVSEDRSRY
jgi:antitoxin (DNA-binding transcriptional repressor) of toxin-antitoxin stability system